jgi:sec-independent protein translocase protein TatC
MSIVEHLEELRRRLIYSGYSVVAGCALACLFIQHIFDFVMLPMQRMLPPGQKMIYTAGAEPLVLYLQIWLIAGVFISSPLILWQVWRFISPALYRHEKRFAVPFILLSTTFFVVGGAFAHYVAFPWTWRFFIGFSTDYMIFLPKVDEAFGLYAKMLLGFGLVFEMPTLVFFLARMGLVSAHLLWAYSRYAVLIIAVVAAVVSPGTDMASMLVMAIPMCGLYGVSIGIAFIFEHKRPPDPFV